MLGDSAECQRKTKWSLTMVMSFSLTALALGSVAIVKVSGQTSPLLFFGPCTTWDVYKILQLNSLFSKHAFFMHHHFSPIFFPVSFKDPLKEVSSSTPFPPPPSPWRGTASVESGCWRRRQRDRSPRRKTPQRQWLFLVPLIGGRWYIIPQLAVYTTYIPLVYCLLGDYIWYRPIKGTRKLHWLNVVVRRNVRTALTAWFVFVKLAVKIIGKWIYTWIFHICKNVCLLVGCLGEMHKFYRLGRSRFIFMHNLSHTFYNTLVAFRFKKQPSLKQRGELG